MLRMQRGALLCSLSAAAARTASLQHTKPLALAAGRPPLGVAVRVCSVFDPRVTLWPCVIAHLESSHLTGMQLEDEDLSRFTVVQLKDQLRFAGLPVSGRKAELIARLSAGSTTSPPVAAPATASFFEAAAATAFPHIEVEACKS